MSRVEVRSYKSTPLTGGSLVVSVPHVGSGSLILTDFLLEAMKMDQVAAFDSEDFPPVAMVRRGKARYPFRIHADPKTRTAVLRCEFPAPPQGIRSLARALLEWTQGQGVERIVALDGLSTPAGGPWEPLAKRVWYAGSRADSCQRAAAIGLVELDQGTLGGVPAILLLEGRLRAADVVVFLTGNGGPLDDAKNALAFAHALKRYLPQVPVDIEGLKKVTNEVEETMRGLQGAAEDAIRRLRQAGSPGLPSMYA